MGLHISQVKRKFDIRLIVSDLDGTLGHDDISKQSAAVIKKHTLDPENHFAIVSARMPNAIRTELDSVGLSSSPNLHIGGYHGNLSYINGERVRNLSFEPFVAQRFYTRANKYGIEGIVFTEQKAYATKATPISWTQWYAAKAKHPVLHEPVPENQPIYMFEFLQDPKLEVTSLYSKLGVNPCNATTFVFNPSQWNPPIEKIIVQFIPSLSGKGNALVYFAQRLNISLSKAMSIGDGEPDIAMLLRREPLTVAMGNANEHVKSAAKFETNPAPHGFADAYRKLVK